MKRFLGVLILLSISLSACDVWTVSPLPPGYPTLPPTGTPIFVTAYVAPETWTPTLTETTLATLPTTESLTPNTPTATLTSSALPATETPTPSATPTPPSATATPESEIAISLLGCDTSLDISHGMGEVTNVYAVIGNHSQTDLTNLCATLSASDEARQHPDKTKCAPTLPIGYQVTLKLTVDTGFKEDTSIQVDVTTDQNITGTLSKESCREIGIPGLIPAQAGSLEPIP